MVDLNKLDEQLDLVAKGQAVADQNELVKTALIVSQLNTVKPDATFRQQAKAKMLAYAQRVKDNTSIAPEPVLQKRYNLRRWLAATSLAILLSSGSVVYAANGAMPDSWLYPVKQATEKIILSLPLNHGLQVKIKLGLAKRRLAEARYLEKKGRANEAKLLFNRFQSGLKEISKTPTGITLELEKLKKESKGLSFQKKNVQKRQEIKAAPQKFNQQPMPKSLPTLPKDRQKPAKKLIQPSRQRPGRQR